MSVISKTYLEYACNGCNTRFYAGDEVWVVSFGIVYDKDNLHGQGITPTSTGDVFHFHIKCYDPMKGKIRRE